MNSDTFVQTLKNLLQLGWVQVNFLKKDNTLREMSCTTHMEFIPVEFHPKQKEEETKTVESTQPDVDPIFKVFEKDKGWRSFRCSQIISISIKKTVGEINEKT